MFFFLRYFLLFSTSLHFCPGCGAGGHSPVDEDRWKFEADEKRYIPHHPTVGTSQAGMPSPIYVHLYMYIWGRWGMAQKTP